MPLTGGKFNMQLDNMSPAAVAAWQELQRLYGQPLNVVSTYRDPQYNEKVGGAKNSQHIHGNAFDISVPGMSEQDRIGLIEMARRAGFQGIGVYDNSLHFDVGAPRAWGADYTRNSLPSWAAPYVPGSAQAAAPQRPEQPQQTNEGLMQAIFGTDNPAEAMTALADNAAEMAQPQKPVWLERPQAAPYQPQRRDPMVAYRQLFQRLRA